MNNKSDTDNRSEVHSASASNASNASNTTLKIRAADDFHYHFRDQAGLARTVPDAAKQFARVIAMPNLKQPVCRVDDALAYRRRILAQASGYAEFNPLMTLYLNAATTIDDVKAAANSEIVHAFKLYPAGVTTGAEFGVKDMTQLYPVFAEMEKQSLPLLVHAEIDDPEVDCFDREAVFIERHLQKWTKQFPNLKIVVEHLTTKIAVDFVKSINKNIAATITPHHLWCNRNDLLAVKLRPHYYCLPILKRASDQQALIAAAISGDSRFFLGSDGAPHIIEHKENSCGCAGIYHGTHTLALYAALFEQQNALDKLEDFSSRFGAEFYGLPLNTGEIILEKNEVQIADELVFSSAKVKPFFSGKTWPWQITDNR